MSWISIFKEQRQQKNMKFYSFFLAIQTEGYRKRMGVKIVPWTSSPGNGVSHECPIWRIRFLNPWDPISVSGLASDSMEDLWERDGMKDIQSRISRLFPSFWCFSVEILLLWVIWWGTRMQIRRKESTTFFENMKYNFFLKKLQQFLKFRLWLIIRKRKIQKKENKKKKLS